jgi:pectin methylesterase-like acyl-CoA thioesterase
MLPRTAQPTGGARHETPEFNYATLLLPIAVLIAVAAIGTTTMQSAGTQSILVVSPTGIDCRGNQLAYTSIQVAVNAALPGSTIRVCPGIYAEQLAGPMKLSAFESKASRAAAHSSVAFTEMK